MNEFELFQSALDLEDPAARKSFLTSACGHDPALLNRVEALLGSHEGQSQFLNTPAAEQIQDASGKGAATRMLIGDGSTQDHEPDVTAGPADGAVHMTTHQEDSDDDTPLGFLEPPTKPGSLGRLAHYEILEVIGRGAFGIVLRAFDEKLQRVVAIKVMAPEMAATSPARKRFLREAQASAAIRHENVVSIYAVEERPIPYLVMEYIPGLTLLQQLDEHGPLDVPSVLRLGREMAEGLAAAHGRDLIHRDIKPGNILLETGVRVRVKITDFGLARAADDASLTQSGTIAGTPMYMAPEQALGHQLDQRADLFSLGSVLYQMVSGRPPFRAPTALAVLKRVAEEVPRPITEIIPETPHWLCDIITKLHAKNPGDRYQSAREVGDVLADCEAQLKEHSKLKDLSQIPHSKTEPAWSWKWAAVLALLLPVLALSLYSFLRPSAHPKVTVNGTIESSTPVSTPASVLKQEPPLAVAPFNAAQAKAHQGAWAKHLGLEPEITNAIGMTLRLIPPGEFTMGSSPEEIKRAMEHVPEAKVIFESEGPARRVRIDQPCYLGVHEVTVGQFRRFVKETGYKTVPETDGVGSWGYKMDRIVQSEELTWSKPQFTASEAMPVVCIEYEDAQAFCAWLSRIEGRQYEIPHESLWEFACRAGTTGLWYSGDQPKDADEFTHGVGPVGGLPPNAFGLFDMLGNVQEFARADSAGYGVRGGGGNPNAWLIRSAFRDMVNIRTFKSSFCTGFRVAVVGDLKAKQPARAIAPFDATQARVHQEAWAKYLGIPVEYTNSIGMKLRLIPPGMFQMGSSPEEIRRVLKHAPDYSAYHLKSEGPVRSVRIDKPCYFGVCEVTVEQFRRFVKETGHKTGPETNGVGSWGIKVNKIEQSQEFNWQNPAFVTPETLPVVCIEYDDAQAFCAWLSRVEGRRYEIPHESVWEFACRAGTTGLWYWGNQLEGWESFIPKGRCPVASKRANAFGLFDMLGNVQEFARTDSGLVAFRGGADNLWATRSAMRDDTNPIAFKSSFASGFRVAIVGDLKAKAVPSIQPFVVLDGKNKKEYVFPTLAEAVAAAVKGDTIEIRGNGPFVTPPIRIEGKSLTLRAGANCHPVFRLDPEGVTANANLLATDAALVLESLELLYLDKSDSKSRDNTCMVHAGNDLSVANCRFLGRADISAIICAGQSCEVRNSIIMAGLGLYRDQGPARTTYVDNCVFGCNTGIGAYEFQDRLPVGSHHATRNTILAENPFLYVQAGMIPDLDKQPPAIHSIRWRSSENVVHATVSVLGFGFHHESLKEKSGKEQEALLHRLTAWEEQYNLYQAGMPFLGIIYSGKQSLAGLRDWEQFWGLKATGSSQGRIRYTGGDLWMRMKAGPEKLVPADFRLHPESVGKGERKDGKDLGADVDLVGPGLAYEKWKKTPEYQDWLKRTGQTALAPPPAVAPFTDADVKRIAALPAAEQVEEVRKELMRRNPGFDGTVEHKIGNDVVTELRIVTDQVTDIAPIRVWSALRTLKCRGTRTNGKANGLLADLTPLEGMNLAGLKHLDLRNTHVSDAGMVYFKDCKNLTHLVLDGTQVEDAGLAHFKDRKGLTLLALGGTRVSDAGLIHFKDCKALTQLYLFDTDVTDAGLVHFQGCKDLTHLILTSRKVTDLGLAQFRDCKNLTHLIVDNTQVGDAGLAHFQGMPLTNLAINNTGITDLTPLQSMPLEDIRLTPKNITRGLDILRAMKSVKTIGIEANQSWPAAEFWARYEKGEFKE